MKSHPLFAAFAAAFAVSVSYGQKPEAPPSAAAQQAKITVAPTLTASLAGGYVRDDAEVETSNPTQTTGFEAKIVGTGLTFKVTKITEVFHGDSGTDAGGADEISYKASFTHKTTTFFFAYTDQLAKDTDNRYKFGVNDTRPLYGPVSIKLSFERKFREDEDEDGYDRFSLSFPTEWQLGKEKRWTIGVTPTVAYDEGPSYLEASFIGEGVLSVEYAIQPENFWIFGEVTSIGTLEHVNDTRNRNGKWENVFEGGLKYAF